MALGWWPPSGGGTEVDDESTDVVAELLRLHKNDTSVQDLLEYQDTTVQQLVEQAKQAEHE